MVSSEAKNGFNCVSCGTFRGDEASARPTSAVSRAQRTRKRPRKSRALRSAAQKEPRRGGAQFDPATWVGSAAFDGLSHQRRRRLSSITRAPCRKVMGVPGQRSQAARKVASAILDASDVLHDAFAVRGPRIDAEGEVSSECAHVAPNICLVHWGASYLLARTARPWGALRFSLGPLLFWGHLPQSSSASRFTAGAANRCSR